MARYWLGPWVWGAVFAGGSNGWKAPADAIASLDLRNDAQCAGTVTPSGFGLFVTPNAIDLGSDYTNLGTDPLATWTQQNLNRWKSALNLPSTLAASNLREVVWETLTIQSDPTGLDRARPIVPTAGRPDYELWLAGSLVKQKRFDLADSEATPLIDQLKRIYRQLRQDSLDGISLPDHYRKVLGHWVRKYRINYRNFQPADLPDEPDIEPTTTITESFNKADSDTLGPDLTWSELSGDWDIVSNAARSPNGNTTNMAQAASDLSSSDHYAKVTVAATTVLDCAAAARCQSGPTTYIGIARTYGSNDFRLFKQVSGSFTQLGSTVSSITWAVNDTIKTKADGSSISGFRNEVSQVGPITDSTIASGTRCGIWCYGVTGNVGDLDNFEAADLAAAARSLVAPRPAMNTIMAM